MKLDVLAFGAHPDDVELSCSGTIIKMVRAGKKVGVVDLTRGELGTRGSAEIRDREAASAAEVLGLTARENLRFQDGFFVNDESHQLSIARMVRKYKPDIVLANAPEDRHPDHGRGAAVVVDGCFISGLRRVETELDGQVQDAWRPKHVFHYIQDRFIKPDFVIDITDFFDGKIDSIKAYSSQFFDPDSKEPESYISTKNFWDFIDARHREMGHFIGAKYGEGFVAGNPLKLASPLDLI